ncbi:NADH-quinone oxidoreductase subunit C [Paludibaculum fermentans]|uniref:NADH-quinone oxidoreductase subunit C n=1 Tax=Paludibaculum fermentans TaxID=1473598 RepID=UPI003EB7A0B8
MPDDLKPEGAPAPEPVPPAQPPPAAPQIPDAAPVTPAAAPKPAAAAAPKPPAAAKPAVPPAPKPPAVMVTAPWEGELPSTLAAEFPDQISAFLSYLGQNFLVAKPASVIPILQSLKDNHGFDYLVDITAVHWPKRDEQFDIIYVLYSFPRNERIRIKVLLKDGERVATATTVHITADWLEREVYDMFGIEFEGHPNMRRILLPDEWSTFPLRKENGILNMDQKWVQENLGIESGQ